MSRKFRRARLRASALTLTQTEILTHGIPFSGEMALVRNDGSLGQIDKRSDEAIFGAEGARGCWERHRRELLEEAEPGTRPAGFYRFDLRVPIPSTWPAELQVLIERGLLTAEEAVAVETIHRVLDPRQPVNFCSTFDEEATVRRMYSNPGMLGILAAEFRFAAEWHAERGREQLAERYRRRAEIAHEVMRERLYA